MIVTVLYIVGVLAAFLSGVVLGKYVLGRG